MHSAIHETVTGEDAAVFAASEKHSRAFPKANPRPTSPFGGYPRALAAWDKWFVESFKPLCPTERDWIELVYGTDAVIEPGAPYRIEGVLTGHAHTIATHKVLRPEVPGAIPRSVPREVVEALVREARASAGGEERLRIRGELVKEAEARRLKAEGERLRRAKEKQPAELDLAAEGLAEFEAPRPPNETPGTMTVLVRLGHWTKLAGVENVSGLRTRGAIRTTVEGKRKLIASAGGVPIALGQKLIEANAKVRDAREVEDIELGTSGRALLFLESFAREHRIELLEMYTSAGVGNPFVMTFPLMSYLCELAVRAEAEPEAAHEAILSGLEPEGAALVSRVSGNVAFLLQQARAGGERCMLTPGESKIPSMFESAANVIKTVRKLVQS